MAKVFNCDTSRIEAMFERLSATNIQSFEGEAIDKALTELQQETISNLTSRVQGATRSGKTPTGYVTKPMVQGVKKRVEKDYAEGVVHIMGDYRLKWFELGTDERFTTGSRSRNRNFRGDIKKTVSAGQSRGKIEGVDFFKDARSDGRVIETYIQSLLTDIEDAFDG